MHKWKDIYNNEKTSIRLILFAGCYIWAGLQEIWRLRHDKFIMKIPSNLMFCHILTNPSKFDGSVNFHATEKSSNFDKLLNLVNCQILTVGTRQNMKTNHQIWCVLHDDPLTFLQPIPGYQTNAEWENYTVSMIRSSGIRL